MAVPKPTHTQYSDEVYKDKGRSQRPSWETRNVKVKNKATNDNFVAANDNAPVARQAPTNDRVGVQYRTTYAQSASQTTGRRRLRKKKSKFSPLGQKVFIANMNIRFVGLMLYSLQFAFALWSIAFFSVAAGISAITDVESEDGSVVGYVVRGVGGVLNFFASFISAINSAVEAVTGVDIVGFFTEALNPMVWAGVSMSLTLFIGLLTLFYASLVYTFANINAFGGKGAGAKVGAFTFAIFGYWAPILSLVPWFVFWTMAVGRNPE